MSVSSLFLSGVAILSVLTPGAVATASSSSYGLVKEYAGNTFFDGFNFNTATDLTQGFVDYVDYQTALDDGLIAVGGDGTVYLGVDSTTVLNPNGAVGRASVRVESKALYNKGLFILDATNMPGGVCGTWPAWWSYGPDWPVGGSVDILEGVNSATVNTMSMQTAPNCTVEGTFQTGAIQNYNCDVDATYGVGCGTSNTQKNSYGSGFNSNNGGVYAHEWTDDYIRIWFFPRGAIPADITAGTPNPALWGTPDTNFQGDCDMETHFWDNVLVLNTDFCGQWAGAVWESDPVCSEMAPTCEDFVGLNPQAFEEMFWAIKSIKVYQKPAAVSSSSSSMSSTSTAKSSSSSSSSSLSLSSLSSSASASASTSVSASASISSSSAPASSSASASSSPSASALPVPTTVPSVGTCSYIGCYTEPSDFHDTGIRTLNAASKADFTGMTIESCASFCSGYAYFGVEYSGECYCGNELEAGSSLTDASLCIDTCAGNAGEYCGGWAVLDVYECDAAQPTLPPASASSSAVASSSAAVSSSSAASSTAASSSVAVSSSAASSSSPVANSSAAPSSSSSSLSTSTYYPSASASLPSPSTSGGVFTNNSSASSTSTYIPSASASLPSSSNSAGPYPNTTTTDAHPTPPSGPSGSPYPSLSSSAGPYANSTITYPSHATTTSKAPNNGYPSVPIYTTVVVTSYVDICPEGTALSTFYTTQTKTVYGVVGATTTTQASVAMTTAVRYLGPTIVTVTIPAVYQTGYPTASTPSSAGEVKAPSVSIVTVVPIAKSPETSAGSGSETSSAAGYVAKASSTVAGHASSATPLQASAGSVMGVSLWLAGVAMGLMVLL